MSALIRRFAAAVPALRELTEENARLKRENDDLRHHVGALRAHASNVAVTPALPGRLSEFARLAAEAGGLRVLDGTDYTSVLMPLDYPPSRNLMPRWGARIRVLDDWFRLHVHAYRDLMREMRELAPRLADVPLVFHEENLPAPAWGGVPYCAFDALTLYALMHRYRPKRYLEIGSGITTCFAHRAKVDAQLGTEITSIDPQPRAAIDGICDVIMRTALETCDIGLFDALEPGDILFFDGSHRAFMNSDVTVFFIDVLPRLKPGVIVHIHDIALPWDYDVSFTNWHWNEAYMCAVYLMGNMHRIEPIAPTAFMCRDSELAELLASPPLDLGKMNDGWKGGGAMWFTHTAPLLVPAAASRTARATRNRTLRLR